MSLYKIFKTNNSLEVKGVWIEYGEEPPIRFRIARAGGSNKAFAKRLDQLTRPVRKLLANNALSDERANEIYQEAFIQTVLLEWENVTDENGNELPLTFENAKKVFTDLPDLFNDLKEQATNMAMYREEELEKIVGNSGRSSPTDLSKDL